MPTGSLLETIIKRLLGSGDDILKDRGIVSRMGDRMMGLGRRSGCGVFDWRLPGLVI